MDSIQLIKRQILLMKAQGLFNYLDRDADKFLRKLKRLNQLLEKPLNERNFNGAYQIFYRINQFEKNKKAYDFQREELEMTIYEDMGPISEFYSKIFA